MTSVSTERPASPSPAGRLAPLLDADSIVVVGASADPARLGGMPVRSLLDGGFPPDRLLLVNPKYREMHGLPCYASVDSLPWAPTLAILAIRAGDTLPTLERCHAIGIRAAVSFASGFAEEGEAGARAQQAIVDFARRTGMRVAGPNCIGVAGFRARVFATFIRNIARRAEPGPFAVVAQSGNMAALLRNTGLEAGMRHSYVASTGNEACIDLVDYLEHFHDDPDTGAVLGYVEQIRRGPAFLQVASRLRQAGKPLFLLKAGTSDRGAVATASHTAAIAGSDSAYRTAFRQVGVATATDPHRLVDLARLWRTGVRAGGRGACVVSLSGAGCALVADHLAREGVSVPALSTDTQARLRRQVPSYGMVSNPVDLTGQVTNDRDAFPAVLDAIAESPDTDVAVLYVMGGLLDAMAPDLIRVAARRDTLWIVIDTADDARSHDALEAGGVVVFRDMNRACSALGAYTRWCTDRAARWQPPGAVPTASPADPLPPEIAAARAARRELLTEVQSKSLLARAGLPMVSERLVTTADEACRAARALGFPVALKVVSADIPHKTEVGGVRLSLGDGPTVRRAFDEVIAAVRRARPDARIDGVVIQPFVGTGRPMLVGIVRDPVFGPMMTVGAGGTDAELDPDVAHRLLPVDEATARAMLDELRCRPLLHGWRGAAPADTDALASAMARLSDFFGRHGHAVAELELNPVVVKPAGQGCLAVDALIRLIDPEAPQPTGGDPDAT